MVDTDWIGPEGHSVHFIHNNFIGNVAQLIIASERVEPLDDSTFVQVNVPMEAMLKFVADYRRHRQVEELKARIAVVEDLDDTSFLG